GPESDGPGGHVLDRPDHTAAESVVDAASAFTGQACGKDLLIGESGAAQVRGQRIPGLRGEADAEFPARLRGGPARDEELASDLPGRRLACVGRAALRELCELRL